MTMRRASRQRGSLIIYVVVALSLLALLGAAYLQIARMDRIATAQLSTSNIDRVAASIVTYVGDVLRDDLLDSNGNFFNQDDLADTTDADEYNDMPWTNDTVNFPVAGFDGTLLTGNAVGGSFDDTWLASTSVDFDTDASKPRWPHITNLNGIGLRIPKTSGSQPFPEELPITNSTDFRYTDTSIDATVHLMITGDTEAMDDVTNTDYQPWGADADGDGIPDSRWTWAPIKSIGGVAYVMAVRIIDNSAMINVNTATGLTSDGGVTFGGGGDYPRGYFPTDVDMTRLLQREANAGGAPGSTVWDDELLAWFGYRPVSTGSTITPYGVSALTPTSDPYGTYSNTSRIGYWLGIGKRATWSQYALPAREELELRYGHGLNFNDLPTAILESYMPTLIRAGDAAGDWTAVVGGSTVTDMRYYLDGGSGAIDTRTFPEIRHFLTGRSNAAIYMPNPDNLYSAATAVTHQYDLVYLHRDGSGNYGEDLDSNTVPDRVTEMYTPMVDVMSIGASDTERYLGQDTATQQQIALEYALNVQDYSDADHVPTATTFDSVTYFYGMEIMPFIREVYLQMVYEDQDLRDNAGLWPMDVGYDSGDLEADGNYDTWVRKDTSASMVIEIGNPFDKDIDNASQAMLNGRIRIVVRDLDSPSTPFAVYAFDATAPDIASRGKLQVYSHGTGAINEGPTYGTDLPTDLGFNGAAIAPLDAGDDVLRFPLDANKIDGTKFTIELQINVPPGLDMTAGNEDDWITYDRMLMDQVDIDVPQQVKHDNFDTTERPQHVQVSAGRDGETVRYISNVGRGLVAAARLAPTDSTWPPLAASQPTPDYRNNANANRVDGLELDTKGAIAGDTLLDNYQIPVANRTIMSVGELGIVQMFGFTNDAAGDFPQRFSGVGPVAQADTAGAATTDVVRRNLDFSSAATVPASTGMPHAAMLLDQFTTLSPRWDGVDNDDDNGDGLDDAASQDNSDYEQVVAGRININTASLEVATLAAPLPEAVDDIQALMESVKTYRDDPTSRTAANGYPTGLNSTRKGIAHLGELMFVNPATPSSTASENMQWAAHTGTLSQKGTVYDTYPLYEVENAGDAVQYDATDGAEEAMARYQFLSQAFTTRSDTFTAYVVVLGYPAGDFRQGAVESKSFYLVYDRSNITTKDDRVQFIGPFER